MDEVTGAIAFYGSPIAGLLCYVLILFKSSSIAAFLTNWPKHHFLDPPQNLRKILLLFTIFFVCAATCGAITIGALSQVFSYTSFEALSTILKSTIGALSSSTVLISVFFIVVFHGCFCISIYLTYQGMIKEIQNIQQNIFSHLKYQPNLFDQYRIQHQNMLAGVNKFMSIFGAVEFIMFLDIVVFGSFLVYQMVYSLAGVGEGFNSLNFFQLILSFGSKTWPLFMFCISSDLAANKVRRKKLLVSLNLQIYCRFLIDLENMCDFKTLYLILHPID